MLTVAVAAGVAWKLSWSMPVWWSPPQNDGDVEAYADRVEYRMMEEAQRIRDQREVWQLRIREEQINAWLATRLPKWVAHHHDLDWPEEIGRLQLHIGEERSSLAIEYFERDKPRVLVAHGRMYLDDGALCVVIEQVDLGRMPLPGRTIARVLERLESVAPDFLNSNQVRDVIDLVQDGSCADPGLSLADGRRVKLLELKPEDGSVVLTCRTAARPRPHASTRRR